MLAELPAEMLRIAVAALFRDFRNALRRIGQEVSGFGKTESDHIVHAGYMKFLLVEKLKISGADMKFSCHIRDFPGKLGEGGNPSAQGKEFLIMAGVLCI